MSGKRKKGSGSVAERRYPYGVESMTRQDDRTLMVWMERDWGSGKVFRLDWKHRSGTVVVRKLADPGDYWFNNWDNSQHGTPSTWEEIDSFEVSGPVDADAKMRGYARDTLGVVQFAG